MARLIDKRRAAINALTRDEICEAAKRVIAAHGIAGLTMALVAKEAGVAKGTLYNYFADKNHLVIDVLLGLFAPLAGRLEEIADTQDAPADQLRQIARAFIDRVAANRSILLMATEAGTPFNPGRTLPEIQRLGSRILRAIVRIFKRGADQGVFRGDPETHAWLFFSLIRGSTDPFLYGLAAAEGWDTTVDEADALMDLVLRGVSTESEAEGQADRE